MYGFDYWNADHYFGEDQHEGFVMYWDTFGPTHACRETQCLFIWDGRFW
jgi:hypothetical protein